MVLLELATGFTPFGDGASPIEVLQTIDDDPSFAPSAAVVRQHYSPEMFDLIGRYVATPRRDALLPSSNAPPRDPPPLHH